MHCFIWRIGLKKIRRKCLLSVFKLDVVFVFCQDDLSLMETLVNQLRQMGDS